MHLDEDRAGTPSPADAEEAGRAADALAPLMRRAVDAFRRDLPQLLREIILVCHFFNGASCSSMATQHDRLASHEQ